jgi:hypothetical protein
MQMDMYIRDSSETKKNVDMVKKLQVKELFIRVISKMISSTATDNRQTMKVSQSKGIG